MNASLLFFSRKNTWSQFCFWFEYYKDFLSSKILTCFYPLFNRIFLMVFASMKFLLILIQCCNEIFSLYKVAWLQLLYVKFQIFFLSLLSAIKWSRTIKLKIYNYMTYLLRNIWIVRICPGIVLYHNLLFPHQFSLY